jgi:hypothetical protein
MNDRYRNVCKALDHIVKCRTKEVKTAFIPYWGYVVTTSEELLKARIRRNLCKESKEFYKQVRSYYETTMQGVPI